MYCSECGEKLENGVCPKCSAKKVPVQNIESTKGNFGWAVLGFFFPLVGLILFLVWRDTRKGDSKVAGIGALVGVGVSILMTIIAIVISILAFTSTTTYIQHPSYSPSSYYGY